MAHDLVLFEKTPCTSQEERLSDFLKVFNSKIAKELKRIYRCPHCDCIVLDEVMAGFNLFCSCGEITHVSSLKIEWEGKD